MLKSARTARLRRKAVLFSCAGFHRGRRVIREKIVSLLIDPHDFGALEDNADHQTLLIESKGVDAAMEGVSREVTGHAFVHDDDARAGANLSPARVVYPVHCILIHQEEGVTEFLNAGAGP